MTFSYLNPKLCATIATGIALIATSQAQARNAEPIDYTTAVLRSERILDWGERPDWSADGKRIAFTQSDTQDTFAFEIDLENGEVRCITCRFGMAGLVTRVYYLPDSSYLFLAPNGLGSANTSSKSSIESDAMKQELYWMPAGGASSLQPLGAPAFGEIAIKRTRNADGSITLAWGDISSGVSKVETGRLQHDGSAARIIDRRTVFNSADLPSGSPVTMAETYNFVRDGRDVTFYTILADTKALNGEMMRLDLETGSLAPLYSDPHHNETHLLADERYGLEESNRASDPSGFWRGVSSHGAGAIAAAAHYRKTPPAPDKQAAREYSPHGDLKGFKRPFDLWMIRIDGSQAPRRLTFGGDFGADVHQSVPSPDGTRVAYAVNPRSSTQWADKGGLYVAELVPPGTEGDDARPRT